MRTAILTRETSGDEGTFGVFRLFGGGLWHSGELPERNNQPGISCILPGTYLAKWLLSPEHGWCYHLQAVPARSKVEIHAANWMGDKSKGYKCELRGCVALGTALGVLEGQKAIVGSRDAINDFHAKMNREDLELTIIGIPEMVPDSNGSISGNDG